LLHDPGGAIDPQHRCGLRGDAHDRPSTTDDQLRGKLADVESGDHGPFNPLFLGIHRDPWGTSQRNAAQLMDVQIQVSIGELIDKITILEIKTSRFQGEALAHVQRELELLEQVRHDAQVVLLKVGHGSTS
jgi:hypothetical protein